MIDITDILVKNADPTYRKFNENIIPGAANMIGVRMPILRSIARDVARGDFRSYLAQPVGDSYEEVMLRGLVIGYARFRSVDEFISAVEGFVPLINNWAVCDCFCSELKMTRRYPEQMISLLEKQLSLGSQFAVRFAVIMLMDYYLIDDYLARVVEILSELDCQQYYVMMAVAWTVSVMMIKTRQEALNILLSGVLDTRTHNKAIQKSIESRRVSQADKDLLRTLKRSAN